MSMLDSLVVEPVQEWDALICSPMLGEMWLAVVEDRCEQLRHRCGASHFPAPVAVVPLPLNEKFCCASGNP